MKAIIKGKRIGGHGSSRRHRILPLFLAAAACCCTYYIANLRQLASTAAQLPYYAVQPSFLGMAVPQGRAVALPSVRISAEESEKIQRKIYGGEGDKAHLGGFTSFDPMGVSPTMWKHMVEWLGVKSLLDVGCGIGTSTS
eukprot:scaffold166121_cov56-Cyclotella_meneghiniana.AAC.1